MRFFATGLFVSFGLARRFFLAGLLTPFRFAAGCVAPGFLAPVRFTAGELDAAQGAAERFDFALVVVLLMFSQIDEFEDFFHLLQRMLEGFHNVADFVGGFGHDGKVLFALWSLGRAMDGISFNGRPLHGRPLNGSLLGGGRFGHIFLRCGCGWFVGGGCRRRGRGGRLALAASTTTAASTASAVRTFPRLRLT
jgi:hypothetical protein